MPVTYKVILELTLDSSMIKPEHFGLDPDNIEDLPDSVKEHLDDDTLIALEQFIENRVVIGDILVTLEVEK